MGLIHPDNHDAFVSYAHDDNTFFDKWIWKLHESLHIKLNSRIRIETAARNLSIDGEFRIYIDSLGLQRTGPVHQILDAEVQSAEMLLVFVGPKYLTSDATRDELRSFERKFGLGLDQIGKRLFIIVLCDEVKTKNWGALEKYRQNNQYWFDFSGGRRPKSFAVKKEFNSQEMTDNPELIEKLDDLLGAITTSLWDLMAPKKRILIGAVTNDLRDHVHNLMAGLRQDGRSQQQGFEVKFLDDDGQFNNWDEQELAEQIGSPSILVLPFSGARVCLPTVGPGGHLLLQTQNTKADRVIWWRVRGGTPIADAGEQASPQQESRQQHLEYLRRRAVEHGELSVDQVVADIFKWQAPRRAAKLLWEGHSSLERKHRLAMDYTQRRWAESPQRQDVNLENRCYPFTSLDKSWAELLSSFQGVLFLAHAKRTDEMDHIRDFVGNVVWQQRLMIEQRSVAVDEEPKAFTPPPIRFLTRGETCEGAEDEKEFNAFLDKIHQLASDRGL